MVLIVLFPSVVTAQSYPGVTPHTLDIGTDTTLYATGHYDRSVRVWNTNTNQVIASFPGPTLSFTIEPGEVVESYDVIDVAIAPNNDRIAASYGGTVGAARLLIYDIDTETLILEIKAAGAMGTIAWSPDGTKIASVRWDGNTSSASRSYVEIWDTSTGDLLQQKWVVVPSSNPEWSPDGQQLAYADTNSIIILDADTWEEELAIENAHEVATFGLAWQPNTHYLATVGDDNIIHIWDTTNGTEFTSLFKSDPNGRTPEIAWSLDGSMLASTGEKSINIHDVSTGNLIHEIVLQNFVGAVRWKNNAEILYVYGGEVQVAEIPLANEPPTANAGADQTVIALDGVSALATLDGSASTDSDGTIVNYSWSENSTEIATGVNPLDHRSWS